MPAAGSPSRTATTSWLAPSSKRGLISRYTRRPAHRTGLSLFRLVIRPVLTPGCGRICYHHERQEFLWLCWPALTCCSWVPPRELAECCSREPVDEAFLVLSLSMRLWLCWPAFTCCSWVPPWFAIGSSPLVCRRGQERPRVANRWRRKAFRNLTFRDLGVSLPFRMRQNIAHPSPPALRLGSGRLACETIHPIVSSAMPNASHPFPIRMPAPSTSEPPRTTWKAARRNGVSIYLFWMKAMAQSSKKTTIAAVIVAVQKCGMR